MTFTPVIRTSNSIPKTLQEFSQERKIDIRLIDFELLHFETLIRRKDTTEFTQVEDLKTITKVDFLTQETQIIQEYSIKIMPRRKPLTHSNIKLILGVNKLKTKAILTIAKGSLFHKHSKILQEFRDMLWKKKLQAGIFIGLFEPQLATQLKKVLHIIPFDQPLAKELKFNVALGIEPKVPIDARFEPLYLQKEHQSIIEGVDARELVARYIKEKRGKDGRACNGRYITVRAPKTLNPKPQTDATICIEETPDTLEYFANDDGYVVLKKNKLFISKTLKLAGANFKSSATIDAGDENRDIAVHIEHQKSHSEDAIGSGVTIDVKELHVDGSVGANVSISTHELNVDAQTHKNSKIEVANQANVKLHRGDMVANNAQIDMLETGKVQAHQSIHIKKMLGGEAIAPIVKVNELLSNSTIIASELIEIHSIEGENNHLIIHPQAIDSHHKDIKEIKETLKIQEKTFLQLEKDFKLKQTQHLAQVRRIKTFQARIKQAKQDARPPMKQDLIRIKLFKQESQNLAQEEIALEQHHKDIEELKKQLHKLQEQDLHAKIITQSSYDGHTKITFITSDTQEHISARPEGKIATITLKYNEKGEKVLHFQ